MRLQSLLARSQFESMATGHHLDLDDPVSYNKDVLAAAQKT